MNLRDLALRLRALVAPRRVERELNDEIQFHLQCETDAQVARGLSLEEARAAAVRRLGSTALVAEECRDARGIGLFEITARDIAYAFRMFRRAPLVALTVVATVGVGLGLVGAVFTIFNMMMFRVDRVPNVFELFAVERPLAPGSEERRRFLLSDYDALRRETSVFTDAFAWLPDIDTRIDGRMMGGTLVTGNFFTVAGVHAARGRTLTPEDDERSSGRPVMVLSHDGWQRLFGGDAAVLGRQVLVSGAPFTIVGVMPEGFRGLSLSTPAYWAPLSRLGQFRPFHAGREHLVGIDIVGRLKPGVSCRTALAGLAVWSAAGRDPSGDRAVNLTLVPQWGTVPDGVEALMAFSPLFFAFGLILMIGCANVANLLLARAVSRQREMGIRLSIGASRTRIIGPLLTESLVLALAAAALGLLVSRAALQSTVSALLSTMPPDLAENVRLAAPQADWRVAAFMVGAAGLSTLLFGLWPALRATRLEPVRTMRGEIAPDSRPSRARNVLVAVQVGASALLLICAAVFLRSALDAATVDPGLRTSDTLMVEIVNEQHRSAMVQQVAADPAVADVAATRPDALARPREGLAEAATRNAIPSERAAGPSEIRAPHRASYRFVSPEYFRVFDIALLRGRTFTAAEADGGEAVAIVAESTARQLWPRADAIGQVMVLEDDLRSPNRPRDEPPLSSRLFTVVGVARDVPGFRLAGAQEAAVYLPTVARHAKTTLVARVRVDPDRARSMLLDRLTAIDPNMGQVVTMRTLARMESYFLQVAFWVTVVLGGLALVLTLSGLFGVISYLVEQRTKEIGVRMALGATPRGVARLVLGQSTLPVSAGLLMGTGLALGLATALMSSPRAEQIATSVRVFDPIAYAGSLLCIVSACTVASWWPARRAARIDPIATLRHD
jgi:predicted permease